MQKINVLEGDWTGRLYTKYVRSHIKRNNLPLLKHNKLPLTHLYDEEFWGNLRSSPPVYASLDPRHWYYDNDVFVSYVNKIASVPLNAVSLFESPLGFERPLHMGMREFQQCLSERTKNFVNIVKGKQPKTKILSPAIRVINPEIQSILLNYLMHHRSYFDIYAVHCCTETTDHTLGALTGFLHQVLNILHKPVWVTRWAIPAFDKEISSSKLINPSDWSPLISKLAAVRLRAMYSAIEEVSESSWFFAGTGDDVYHPDTPIPTWKDRLVYQVDFPKHNWEPYHFLGLVDYQGDIKQDVLDSLIGLNNG